MNLIIDRKIRMAIVGCGYISKNHFGSIGNRQDNIELISTFDVQKAVLSKHKETYKVKGNRK
jgi:UDP-N-acetyl-2-amino-2-deoxyglucuronate dehydrogenase